MTREALAFVKFGALETPSDADIIFGHLDIHRSASLNPPVPASPYEREMASAFEFGSPPSSSGSGAEQPLCMKSNSNGKASLSRGNVAAMAAGGKGGQAGSALLAGVGDCMVDDTDDDLDVRSACTSSTSRFSLPTRRTLPKRLLLET